MNIHFISGLPRSGSTLLSAILRQNPKFTASMSSPVGGIFSAMQRAVSRGNEASIFLNDIRREKLLLSCFKEVYDNPAPPEVIFDTNRIWPSKLPTLVKLFPDCRIICCVRRIAWIMDSIERLIRKNTWELSGIFGFEPGSTVYTRCAGLGSSNGLVGFAVDALREGFYGEHRKRMVLIEYEALAKSPLGTLKALYNWLGYDYYEGHDFENIEQIPGTEAFDEKLGTPGLHSVRSKVEWKERNTVLPPELFSSFPAPFWRSNNPDVPVIHYDFPKIAA